MNECSPEVLNELLARTALRDKSAFQQLYRLYGARLNGIAYRIVRNKDAAGEITQEAFLQIWKNSSNYNPAQAEPGVWMNAIVRYRAYDHIRSEGNRLEGQLKADWDLDVGELNSEMSDLSAVLASRDALNRCLSSLEEEQRRAVVLAYYYGFSRDELASYFKRSVNTVKTVIRRGVMRLQVCLSE